MQQKLESRAFEHVKPLLQPGERPVAATRALVGKFSASRIGMATSQSVFTHGYGAVGAVLVEHRKQFVVVTSHRLIFLSQTFLGGPGKEVLGEISRSQVSLAEAKIGIVSLLRIAFGPMGDGISLTFPRLDKKNAESLAAALSGGLT